MTDKILTFETLEEKCVILLAAFEAWCDADGWENPAYDDFSDAIYAIADHIGHDIGTPHVPDLSLPSEDSDEPF